MLVLALLLAMSVSIPYIGYAASGLPAPPPVIDMTDYSKINRDPTQTGNIGVGIAPSTPEELAQDAQYRRQQLEKDAISMTVYELSNRKLTMQAAATWIRLTPIYYHGMTAQWEVGPACAYMAITYLTGSLPSFDSVVAGCKATVTNGATLSNIRDYLNSIQSKNSYLKITSTTKTTFIADMYADIVTWDAPPIVAVNETYSDGWPFSISNHGVVVNGILSDKSALSIADPFAGFVGDLYHTAYPMPIDAVYSAFTALGNGFIY